MARQSGVTDCVAGHRWRAPIRARMAKPLGDVVARGRARTPFSRSTERVRARRRRDAAPLPASASSQKNTPCPSGPSRRRTPGGSRETSQAAEQRWPELAVRLGELSNGAAELGGKRFDSFGTGRGRKATRSHSRGRPAAVKTMANRPWGLQPRLPQRFGWCPDDVRPGLQMRAYGARTRSLSMAPPPAGIAVGHSPRFSSRPARRSPRATRLRVSCSLSQPSRRPRPLQLPPPCQCSGPGCTTPLSLAARTRGPSFDWKLGPSDVRAARR